MPRATPMLLPVLLALTTHTASAATPNPWPAEIESALQSKSVLAHAGAILALRDLALTHPNDAIDLYLRQPPALRRRLALALGDAEIRNALIARSGLVPNSVDAWIAGLGSDDFATRKAAQANLARVLPLVEDRLQKLLDAGGDPEILSRVAELLAPLAAGNPQGLPPGDSPEHELLRWCVEMHLEDAYDPPKPGLFDVGYGQTYMPLQPKFLPQLSPAEKALTPRMLHLCTAIDQHELLWKLADPEPESPLHPWDQVLLTIGGIPDAPWLENRDYPRLVALAPLFRPMILRFEHATGNCAILYRKTLCEFGDIRALDGIDNLPVEKAGADPLQDVWEIERAAIKARMGRNDGLDWLLRTPTSSAYAGETLSNLVEVQQGPSPFGFSARSEYWLTPDENEIYKRPVVEMTDTEDGGPSAKKHRELGITAQVRYRSKLQTLCEANRPDLVWSSGDQRWQLKSMPQKPLPAPPAPYPGLEGFSAAEDPAAARWYKACTLRLFDSDLAIAVAAARALQWGQTAAAQAILDEALARARAGDADAAALLRMIGHRLPDWPAIAAANPAALRIIDAAAQHGGIMEDQFPLAAELTRKSDWDRLAEVQHNLRANLHPAILPLLIVDAECDTRTWDFIAAIDKSARSKPFLLREFARQKTGADRGEYRAGRFWSLYDAAVQLHATETIPALKRAVERADTQALIPLAQLAGSDVHDFLLSAEARKVYGESSPGHPVDLNTAIFLTGDLSRLDAVISLTYGGEENLPFDAADALRAVCPAASPPDLPYDAPMAQREAVHAFWQDWAKQHAAQLIWNREARRYVLKEAGEK